MSFDWYDVGLVDIGGGWELVDCQGDGPLVCAKRDGSDVGFLEIATYPVASLPAVRDNLAKGEVQALEAHATEYVRSMRADRSEGCGPRYSFDAGPPRRLLADDGVAIAITYGFSGARAGEPVTERTVQWAGIRDDDLVLVTTSAYDRNACLAAEQEGTTADLALLAPRIDRLVRANGLPAPRPSP